MSDSLDDFDDDFDELDEEEYEDEYDDEYDDDEFDDDEFDDEDFEEDEEGETEETSGNRLFIILAVGLVGLVVLGLVAIGGVLVFRSMYGQDEVVEATPTIVADELEPTLTPQSDMSSDDTLSSATTETLTGQNGEVVTPSDGLDITSTLLPLTTPVQPGTGENGEGGGESGTMQTATSQALAVAPTAEPVSPNTPVPVATPASHEQVPATGTGILGFVLIGLGLVTLVFTARFLRHAS